MQHIAGSRYEIRKVYVDVVSSPAEKGFDIDSELAVWIGVEV